MRSGKAIFEEIRAIEGIGLSSNIYALGREDITLVDAGAGDYRNQITPKFEILKLKIEKISQVIITHAHFDHIGGLTEILRRSAPEIYAHINDVSVIEGVHNIDIIRLKDGDAILTEIISLRVIHTPGHTHGSICLHGAENGILFSGDTVFADGFFGRTDLPSGSSRAMLNSLEKLKKLNVKALFPGHGSYALVSGSEIIKLAYKRAKSFL